MRILRHWFYIIKSMKLFRKILFYFELRSYGVSEWWARKLNVRTNNVRLFFVYLSFATLGSSLLLYLPMAFVLDHRHRFKFSKKSSTIWEL